MNKIPQLENQGLPPHSAPHPPLLAEAALAIQGLYGCLTSQELPTSPLHLLEPPTGYRGPGSPAEGPNCSGVSSPGRGPLTTGLAEEQASPVFRDRHTPFSFLRPSCSHHPRELQTTGEVPAQLPRSGPTPQLY